MKSIRQVLSLLKDPISIWEYYAAKKLSRDSYMLLICLIIACCGFIQGFLVVHTNLIISDSQFLYSFHQWATESQSNSFRIDDIEHFWSLLYGGEILGAMISFPFVDNFGRKLTYIGSSIGCLFCLTWMIFATSLVNVFSLRFGIGVCLGILLVSAPIYIAEIEESLNRGQSVSFVFLSNVMGSWTCLLVYPICRSLWPTTGWRVACILPLLVSIVSIYVVLFLPDSPRFLLAKKTPTDCARALKQLRQRMPCNSTIGQQTISTSISHHSINVEFNDMYRGLSNDARHGDSFLELCGQKPVRHRICLLVCVYVLQGLLNGMITWWCMHVFQAVLAATTSDPTASFSSEAQRQDVSSALGYGKFYLYSLVLGGSCFLGCYFLHQRIDQNSPGRQHHHNSSTHSPLMPGRLYTAITDRPQHSHITSSHGTDSSTATPVGHNAEDQKKLAAWAVGRRGLMVFSALGLACIWLVVSGIVYIDSELLVLSSSSSLSDVVSISMGTSTTHESSGVESFLRMMKNESGTAMVANDGSRSVAAWNNNRTIAVNGTLGDDDALFPTVAPSAVVHINNTIYDMNNTLHNPISHTNDTIHSIAPNATTTNTTTARDEDGKDSDTDSNNSVRHRHVWAWRGCDWLLWFRQLVYLFLLAGLLFCYSCGWGYIPSLLVVEYFPYRARSKIFGILSTLYYGLLQTVFRCYYQDAFDLSGNPTRRALVLLEASNAMGWSRHVLLGCLGCVGASLLIAGFSWWLLPETAGVMLEDVEEIFRVPSSNNAPTSTPASSSANASLSGTAVTLFRGVMRRSNSSCSCLLPPWHYYFPVPPPVTTHNTAIVPSHQYHLVTPARLQFQLDAKNAKNLSGGSRGEHFHSHPFYEPTSLHKYSREMRETCFHYCADSSCCPTNMNNPTDLYQAIRTKSQAMQGYGSIFPSDTASDENEHSDNSSTVSFNLFAANANANGNGTGSRPSGVKASNNSYSVFGHSDDTSNKLIDDANFDVSPFSSSWPFRNHDTP